MLLRVCFILHYSTVVLVLLYYSIVFCEALRMSMDVRHTNTILTD